MFAEWWVKCGMRIAEMKITESNSAVLQQLCCSMD